MLNKLDFVRIAAVSPHVKVADTQYNTDKTIEHINRCEKDGVALVVFPELNLTAYTCGDLFLQPTLLEAAMDALKRIVLLGSKIIAVVGIPISVGGMLFNCAAVVSEGKVWGVVPKTYIPNYNEYYEKRWFDSGRLAPSTLKLFGSEVSFNAKQIFVTSEFTFGIEICEDLWAPIPPSGYLAQRGAEIIVNLSASNELVTKHRYRRNLISQQSGRLICAYAYSGAGRGESTTDLVFGGYTAIYENGRMLDEGKMLSKTGNVTITDVDMGRLRFHRGRNKTFFEDINMQIISTYVPAKMYHPCKPLRLIDAHPFIPKGDDLFNRLYDITAIQTAALIKRMEYIGIQKAAVAVSGGLDSALTLLIAARSFKEAGYDLKGLHAITMPGFGTTDRTKNNAIKLMGKLKCTQLNIPIKEAVRVHFEDIRHDAKIQDTTYENSQARERYQILMDYSNKIGGIALGTGDMSELALGWCTYNGDHMSMYNVNCSIPKTLVKYLVKWLGDNSFDNEISEIISDILDTPISPELLPSEDGKIVQKTEEILGKYELHDFFLYNMLEGGASPSKLYYLARIAFSDICEKEIYDTLEIFIRRFFSQQFKRSCMPDGPKVGTVSLSPRGDWRMPSDASSNVWLRELKSIKRD